MHGRIGHGHSLCTILSRLDMIIFNTTRIVNLKAQRLRLLSKTIGGVTTRGCCILTQCPEVIKLVRDMCYATIDNSVETREV